MNPVLPAFGGPRACLGDLHCSGPRAADGTSGAPVLRDLVKTDGSATRRAHEFDGQRLKLRGYIAPSLVSDPALFLLTEGSLAPCMLCGCVHSADVGLLVAPRAPLDDGLSMTERVDVLGRLRFASPLNPLSAPDGDIRLVDAIVRRAPIVLRVGNARRWLQNHRPAGTGGCEAPQARRALPRTTTPAVAARPAGPAEVILRGGKIHTVDEAFSTAEAVAVRGGRFVAVGDNDSVLTHAGPETDVIDLRGKAAVPGLIDSHLHQIYVAANIPTVDLLDARSIADVQSKIADRAATLPTGEWVVASSGWHESILAEGRLPTRWELDEAAPANPVIIPRGGHVVTVNSLALERAGITDATPDPTGGVIVRDPESGGATGVLLETAAYFARRVAPPLPAPDVMVDQLKAAMAELNSYGIVGVIDPVVDENSIEVYRRLRDAGGITVRTDLLYKATDKAQTETGIAAIRAGTSDDMLRYVGLKFMLDGGVEGARLREPYRIVPGEQPHPDYHG
ncbi:MAG: amidohydrolase family protein, partial [Alphaproteobacteria bacterium]|nr:amidohydrolase family protein [Alphaproteobacteria bacterium]